MQINIKGKLTSLTNPLVMGILNITPDSFFDGGKYSNTEKAIIQIEKMLNDGADIIDIGAMSSRPGAKLIDIRTEWERLEPILKVVVKKFPNAIFSLDTIHAEIAERAISDYSISMINDISAGEIDKDMFEVIAKHNTPYILMHMRGKPENMNQLTSYSNIIEEIILFFSKKIQELNSLGVNDIIIDPGFGFSKTIDQNYYILNRLDRFKIFNLPILAGVSRKSMAWKYLNIEPDDSLIATQALNIIALTKGSNIIRVHDVKETKQIIKIHNKLTESKESL